MHIDKISDMIAHFIGLFDTVIEDARLRTNYSEGPARSDPDRLPDDEAAKLLDKNYDVPLQDYDPGVKYSAGYYDFDYIRPHFARAVEYDMQQLANAIPVDISAAHFRFPGRLSFEEEYELVVHPGPGSVIAHVAQVNILQDDDYLNMTDGPYVWRDTSFVTERTVEFYNEAAIFTPFSVFQRTDSYDALQALAKSAHDYIDHARENDVTSLGTGADQDFVLAGNDIDGLYVNGSTASEKPMLDDYMPDRGIAKPPEEPEKSDVSLHEDSPAGNSLDVAAGANVVANIATLVNTGVMTSVTAVMGDYHQIDAITQAYIYSDRDEIDSVFTHSEDQAATVAFNIASFERTIYPGAENAAADSQETGAPQYSPPPGVSACWKATFPSCTGSSNTSSSATTTR
ncbi:type I secretion system ATPase [Agrobacterium tumefaciens]|nr:type I secretion system ATPase [Agrobacterium tumefaciens]